MLNRLARSARTLALVCSPLLLLSAVPQQPGPPTQSTQPHVYSGTVHAVQAQTGSLDLITGVGHALRLIRIATLPATRTMSGVAAIRFADLAPGDQLRVECRVTASGLVADRIDRLPAPGSVP
jgi:hypothetical protein